MLVKIEQKYLENLTYFVGGHSITKFALRGERVPSKCEHMQTAGKEIISLQMFTPHIIFFK